MLVAPIYLTLLPYPLLARNRNGSAGGGAGGGAVKKSLLKRSVKGAAARKVGPQMALMINHGTDGSELNLTVQVSHVGHTYACGTVHVDGSRMYVAHMWVTCTCGLLHLGHACTWYGTPFLKQPLCMFVKPLPWEN